MAQEEAPSAEEASPVHSDPLTGEGAGSEEVRLSLLYIS
jgi:hypothetical protein